MNRKNFITALIVLGVILVIYFWLSNRTWHPENWQTQHKVVYNRLKKGDMEKKNCLDCHEKKYKQSKANFCNKCHLAKGLKPIE